MKLILIFLTFSLINIQAGLINSIAVKVNKEIITSVDVDNKMQEKKISKEKAIILLVDEALYQQSLKNLNIKIDIEEMNKYIKELAKKNKMTSSQFKKAVKQEQNYKSFTKSLQKRLTYEKFVAKVSSNKLQKVTEDEMLEYYHDNKYRYKQASKVDLRVYATKNKNALYLTQENPMMLNNEVEIQNITLNLNDINKEVKNIIEKTKVGSFSSIFTNQGVHNMFYLIKKHAVVITKFIKVKNSIFNKLMIKRQNEFLKTYFESLKATAKIEILQ